jgi:predicted nucleic acid-binding protein
VKRRVYIETSIPSFYYTTRAEPKLVGQRETTRRWWATERQWFELCTSEIALRELAEGDYPSKLDAITLMKGIPLLGAVPRIAEIVAVYARHKLMPANNLSDAFHLAFASYYDVDYLLTWNCAHLANVNKQTHIEAINDILHLKVPIITTPEFLFSENTQEEP